MHLGNLRFRIGFAAIAVLAIAVVVIALGAKSDAPSASAAGPQPTPIGNDGSLGGVSDILVSLSGDITDGTGSYYCIAKTNHEVVGVENDTNPDLIETALQCNIDIPNLGATGLTPPGWVDTDPLLTNPSEPGADGLAGPPPPPPYTVLAPSKGYGFYYDDGSPAACAGTPCTIVTSCFQDVGSPDGLGPNIMSTATILNPGSGVTIGGMDDVSSGTVNIYFNENNANCKALTPATAAVGPLPIFSVRAYDKGGTNVNANPAAWRAANAVSTTDWDGDGCTDEEELIKNGPKCGDDPQNPSDSFDVNTVDLSGIYDITTRVIRADDGAPGIYFYCRADLQHNTGDNSITVTPYCYSDSIATDINPEGYPGVTGDGYSGGPPPGPCTSGPAACPGTFPGDDYAFGDVDANPTVLSGTLNKSTNNVEIAGCFEDQDGQSDLGNVYVELAASAHQLPGTVDIWVAQTIGDCNGAHAFGDYEADTGNAPTFDNAEVSFVQPNPAKAKGYDQDDDGAPTADELGTGPCGHRDPYNAFDYYDVSIPRDGVIDLSNDILGVILHYSPAGYGATPSYVNFDRGASITGSAGNWNRHAPDAVIDLSNDILGVILQYNPGGC